MRWLLPILACALLAAPGWAQMGDRNTGAVCVYPADAFLNAGKGGRVLNVREAPFGAKGDGATDDTQAFIRAYDYVANLVRRHGIHDTRASFIIYIPEGTYLVSDTILYSGELVDYAAVRPGYEGMAGTRFIGQNRERTIVKLKDHDVTIDGFDYPMLAGCVFKGQTEAGIFYSGRIPLLCVGCRFEPQAGTVFDLSQGGGRAGLNVIDYVIATAGGDLVKASEASGIYLENVYVPGAAGIRNGSGRLQNASPWTRIRRYASCPPKATLMVSGKQLTGEFPNLRDQ